MAQTRKKDTYTQAQELVRDVLLKFDQKVNAGTMRSVAKKLTDTVPSEPPVAVKRRA